MCDVCGGTGTFHHEECPVCQGTGQLKELPEDFQPMACSDNDGKLYED